MKSLIFTCVCMKRQKQIEYYAPQMNMIDLFSCNKREYLSFFLYLSLSDVKNRKVRYLKQIKTNHLLKFLMHTVILLPCTLPTIG